MEITLLIMANHGIVFLNFFGNPDHEISFVTWARDNFSPVSFFRVEKYRPKQLDDLISHQDIISTSE